MTAVVSDPSERAALQQRVLRVLALGQVVGGAALASAVTVGAFVVQDILGHDTPWAGTATAVTTTGTGFMSQVLARKMSRHGRRPGLRLGYGLAAVGGGIAAVGVETLCRPTAQAIACGRERTQSAFVREQRDVRTIEPDEHQTAAR